MQKKMDMVMEVGAAVNWDDLIDFCCNKEKQQKSSYHNIGKEIKKLEKMMKSSAKDLDFEQAAKYRDLIKELKDKVLINKA